MANPNGQTPLQQAHCKQLWIRSPSGIPKRLSLNAVEKGGCWGIPFTAIVTPPVQKRLVSFWTKFNSNKVILFLVFHSGFINCLKGSCIIK
jgi:hypothetical protein